MKADHINPFVNSAKEVLQQFVPNLEIERGELGLEPTPADLLGATVYLGISGFLEGRVVYDMEPETAVNIASAMNHEELTELNELARSTIQELGNMISGNAATKLRERVETADEIFLSPPSMIMGEDTKLSDSAASKYLKIPLETNLGELVISVAVKESS